MRTKTVVGMVVLLTACAAVCTAAEKIHEDEITKRIAPVGTVIAPRGFTIVTLDGRSYHGRSLEIEHDALRISLVRTSERIPFAQVARVEISQCGRFSHHIVDAAVFPLSGSALSCSLMGESPLGMACFVTMTAALSPVWGYAAASAPFYLIADGVGCILPPKVYEIVH
jgi:hypothetical protein